MKKKIYSKALDKEIDVGRVIGHIKGRKPGPTLVFLGGIHGNEPSGLFALHQVYSELLTAGYEFNGTFVAISGHHWALQQQKRYHKYDLNRMWSPEGVTRLKDAAFSEDEMSEDITQQKEIFQCLHELFATSQGPYYFFDLHTTSSATEPFITINDTLLNRKFAGLYPVPIILGIEEYLDGPLLSYINELGYIAIGFEAGQHDALSSFENHKSFIYLSLVNTGCIDKNAFDDYNKHFGIIGKSSVDMRDIFEISVQYKIKHDDAFTMNPGYVNFQPIQKNEYLATNQNGRVHATMRGRIFMPLYQEQGDDGYFIIRKIPGFLLRLSATLRKWKSYKFLIWLPGIKWYDKQQHALIVNTGVARFLTKQVFHLLGYRSRKQNETSIMMRQREYNSKNEDYAFAPWNT
jgi:hypothetical protein